jgi:recombination protein RecA
MAEDNSMKLRSLEIAMEQIEKDHGKGAVMKLGDKPIAKLEAISTGSISLDSALGIGGVPRGRIIEIYGPESSGKTTVCLHIIAEAMRNGGLAAFIDTEHALDTGYAQKLGVDVGNLLISQPEYGEQALEICETLVRSNALDVIVVDSVAALTPRAEIEGEMGDAVMGMQARLMSQALRKLTAAVSKSNVVLIFTNQLREKIGVMFGSPETTTGGKALKFYASIRMDIRRIAAIKDGTDVIGNRTKVKIVKNKVAPPFKEVEFDILYNEGISKMGDLVDFAVNKEIIKKGGAWFTYGEMRMQGKEGVKKALLEDRDALKKLYGEVKIAAGIGDAGSNGTPESNGAAKKAKDENKEEVKEKAKK